MNYSPINMGVPPNRQAVLDWYRQSEKSRLAGLDDSNNVEPWFHGKFVLILNLTVTYCAKKLVKFKKLLALVMPRS